MNTRTKDAYMYSLGAIVLLAVISFIGFLCIKEAPVNNQRLLDIAFGALLGAFTTIISFYFGSSKGSADKTEILSRQSPPPTP